MHSLDKISPIDGRYRRHTAPLGEFFSEAALMRYRLIVECEYLIALSELQPGNLRQLSADEKQALRGLYQNFAAADAEAISDLEFKGSKNSKPTQHDVKAVEYFMKDRLAGTSLIDISEWLHFGLTSYDINTPARGLMLGDALAEAIIPAIEKIYNELEKLARQYKNLPMLARTHGQPASPTTFGKEFRVFSERLRRQLGQLKNAKISVKFSGATGNWNAHVAAFPKIDWISFSQKFIAGLNAERLIRLELNITATQIDPHDSEAEIFDSLRRVNTILLGFNQDMWRYISDEWIVQKAVAGEVGSSTMPHKINPIKFENSEGNLGMANAIFNFFAAKLPISRLQRDLSDSTVERNFGVALGHCLIAYNYLLDGLSRIAVNENKVLEDLRGHPEIITEAIQTILRREGVAMPYEKLKELTRGKKIAFADIAAFIDGLDIPDKLKTELKTITPETYTGLAGELAERADS